MTYVFHPQAYSFAQLFDVREGAGGDLAAALQLNLRDVTVDGDFGSRTRAAVEAFQRTKGLPAHGVAGYLTQRALVRSLSEGARQKYALPVGVLSSLADHESSYALAAYAPHPSDSGFDLGAYQNSIGPHGDPATQETFRLSYDVAATAAVTAKETKVQQALYKEEPAVLSPTWYGKEVETARGYKPWIYAYQLAIFRHNWPSGADNLAQLGSIYQDPSRDDEAASWIETASGGRLHTPRQWFVAYVEGATQHVAWT